MSADRVTDALCRAAWHELHRILQIFTTHPHRPDILSLRWHCFGVGRIFWSRYWYVRHCPNIVRQGLRVETIQSIRRSGMYCVSFRLLSVPAARSGRKTAVSDAILYVPYFNHALAGSGKGATLRWPVDMDQAVWICGLHFVCHFRPDDCYRQIPYARSFRSPDHHADILCGPVTDRPDRGR